MTDTSDLFNQLLKEAPVIASEPPTVELKTTKNNQPNVQLTTKSAVEFLIAGTLREKVCKICLNVTSPLTDMHKILHIAVGDILYQISIKDMITNLYPFKIIKDPHFPNRICEKCIDRALNAYLFVQQCERAQRALVNCFDDINEKYMKLDPLERQKRRGRHKQKPNHNVLNVAHKTVIEYAQPIMFLINKGSSFIQNQNKKVDALQCLKCWQVMPSLPTLLNHEKIHPNSMWYSCNQCGLSFSKLYQLKRHTKISHSVRKKIVQPKEKDKSLKFTCSTCGEINVNYLEHVRHIEKHKFKTVLENLLVKKTDQYCTVCLGTGSELSDISRPVAFHGESPNLMGEKCISTLLGTSMADMKSHHNYIGTKICDQCLSNLISSYVFVNHTMYLRRRLCTTLNLIVNNLNKTIDTSNTTNIFIELSDKLIVDIPELYMKKEKVIQSLEENDESKLPIDVLEDEYRLKSSDSEDEIELLEFKNMPKLVHTYSNAKDNRKSNKNTQDSRYSRFNGMHYKGNNDTLRSIDICSEFLTFKNKKSKRKHRKIMECPFCYKRFWSTYYFLRHIRRHSDRTVTCNKCNKRFRNKFVLREHNKTHETNKNTFYPCKICGRTYKDAKRLSQHVKTHRNCSICSKSFKSVEYCRNHMQRHAMKLKVCCMKNLKSCSFCEREFADSNDLDTHINKTHLQVKSFACDICNKKFYTSKDLVSHKIIHSVVSKEKCDFCDKILNSRRKLVIHVRKHLNNKPFTCFVCRESFYSEEARKRHIKKTHREHYSVTQNSFENFYEM